MKVDEKEEEKQAENAGRTTPHASVHVRLEPVNLSQEHINFQLCSAAF